MYLFFTDKENIGSEQILLDGPDVNHIKNVLRLKAGDKIRISDGDSQCYVTQIESFESEKVKLIILQEDLAGTELPAEITLYQCLPKGDKMELIIQKNVELGVHRIVPVASKRAVVKLDQKKAESKRKRWQAIAESAAKQSKRVVIPEIGGVVSFKAAAEQARACDFCLLPYEKAEGIAFTRSVIDSIRPGSRVAVFIGPEGGFEDDEAAYATESGFIPITLGRRILRTETAGLALMALLSFRLEPDD